jgi:hypothetical protein
MLSTPRAARVALLVLTGLVFVWANAAGNEVEKTSTRANKFSCIFRMIIFW